MWIPLVASRILDAKDGEPMNVECYQCGLNYSVDEEQIWTLAERLHEIWWLRWAGDTQAWPIAGDDYKKVWFDIAAQSFKQT
jgi:hypothetical protein